MALRSRSVVPAAAIALGLSWAAGCRTPIPAPEPLVYTIRVASPESQSADVEVSVPTEVRLELPLTSYYTGLMLRSAGLRTEDQTLSSLSRQIARLQENPGRLKQTLEQSSYDVWTNSLSGVRPDPDTVSYYVKGYVLGFLLDAKIRRMTEGGKSLDDVMRLACQRFGAERGFTPDDFLAIAEEVAGGRLEAWFRKAVASAEELDYDEALEWLGLRFADGNGAETWELERRDDRSELQEHQLREWLRSGPPNR